MKPETRNLVISIALTLVIGAPSFCESVGVHVDWPLIWSALSTWLAPFALIATGVMIYSAFVSSKLARKDEKIEALEKQVDELRNDYANERAYTSALLVKIPPEERMTREQVINMVNGAFDNAVTEAIDNIDIDELSYRIEENERLKRRMRGISAD